MNALPALPAVLQGYPVTARWIYQTVRMAKVPLSQRQVADLLKATVPSVSKNVKLLTEGGLLHARRGVLQAVTGDALAQARPFTPPADLGPTVINGAVKHATLAGRTRFRFGHPPIHVFYIVTRPAQGNVPAEILLALADNAQDAARVLHPDKGMPVREGYHMREDGKYEWVLPPFTTLRAAKQKAAIAGAEKGTPYQVVRFRDGLYTAIPADQPLPEGAESAFVQPLAGTVRARPEQPGTPTGDSAAEASPKKRAGAAAARSRGRKPSGS